MIIKQVRGDMEEDVEKKVKSYYPQALAAKSRFWYVYRDPSGPHSKTYLGRAATKSAAWDKALRNIKRGPQCCLPHPLDYVVCDEHGNTVEIENGWDGRVLISVIEYCPKGESRTSQSVITNDLSKIAEIRDALTRILAEREQRKKK